MSLVLVEKDIRCNWHRFVLQWEESKWWMSWGYAVEYGNILEYYSCRILAHFPSLVMTARYKKVRFFRNVEVFPITTEKTWVVEISRSRFILFAWIMVTGCQFIFWIAQSTYIWIRIVENSMRYMTSKSRFNILFM